MFGTDQPRAPAPAPILRKAALAPAATGSLALPQTATESTLRLMLGAGLLGLALLVRGRRVAR